MNAKIDSIASINTQELCELPPRKKTTDLKWIFKTKFNAEGHVQKYKARVVAKGYTQMHGIDYDEVLSLVARIETVRFVLY